ncbi:glycosyltransferase family 4 protein [Asaia sp. As-1742]|uniref:glycosyltransferase family 4 protein n=1 Tax=Asaia sp. As-1742 TaxID=2608325 RepID=UPI00141F290A|nr:glycosyltransferase family 4 protein [Asaia sp. As-1742]NIE79840.1 glycosyltransferase family 4 protein [Asaia sp. As-1742]
MKTEIKALNDYFDGAFYLAANPDVAEANMDPFEHFCSIGWREGRDPSISFDTKFYLRQYPDIAAAGVNPLLHYLEAGQYEGRKIMPPLREERLRVQHALWSMNYRAKNYEPEIPEEGILSSSRLSKLLSIHLLDAPVILSVSHDDYSVNVGGVQKLLCLEEAQCHDISWNYLHLSPSCHRLGLATHEPEIPVALSLRLNGRKLGHVTPAVLLRALQEIGAGHLTVFAVIHHLMGHDPREIATLVEGMKAVSTIVWTHDFFTLCSGIQLMRNDAVYCHAPAANSMSCGICSHGGDRPNFMNEMALFFERVDPIVMAPSQAAADIWAKHSPYQFKMVLGRPLGRLILEDSRIPYRSGSKDKPIRVAFLGYRTHLKGWNTFQRLALELKDDPRYEFHHLGMAQSVPASGNIIHTPVNSSSQGDEAMVAAAVARNIDVVINWALWPETFCYAAYEALASGAFLIAPEGEGNVSALLRDVGAEQGLLLRDEEELFALFVSERLSKLMRISSRRRGYLIPSGDSVSWLARAHTETRAALGGVS